MIQNWFCRSETHQQLKKACKSQIKNKVESDKFATKLEACLEKKIRKYKKKQAKVCKKSKIFSPKGIRFEALRTAQIVKTLLYEQPDNLDRK